jgi:hypothetical protein
VTFLRCHGVSLVATIWLLGLIAGVTPVLVVAVGVPCMVWAVVAYVAELRERYGRRW